MLHRRIKFNDYLINGIKLVDHYAARDVIIYRILILQKDFDMSTFDSNNQLYTK